MSEKISGPPPVAAGSEARVDQLPSEINPTPTKPATTAQAKSVIRFAPIPASGLVELRHWRARYHRRPPRRRYHGSADRGRRS